jgi:hypothetical protein
MRLSKAYNLNHEFDGLVQLTQVFSSFLIDFFFLISSFNIELKRN